MAEQKVLKTLVIKDGKVVEERVIKMGSDVTVGSSPKCTFVLTDSSVPTEEFALFAWTGSGYQLRVTDGMNGKVAIGGAKGTLKKLRKDQPELKTGAVWAFPLGEDDKGSVDIGDGAVWFKFEAAPEPPPPQQTVVPLEQVDYRPRFMEDDDPMFFGWLSIWSAMASVLVVWVWSTEPVELTLEELPDRYTRLVIQEKPVDPPKTEVAPDPTQPAEPTQATEAKPEPRKQESPEERAQRQDAARKEVLQQSKLLARLIGTTGDNSRGAVENMWGDDRGLGDIDGALGEVAGISTEGAAELRSGEGTGGERADIGELGGVESGNAAVGIGPKVEAKPTVSAEDGSLSEDVGDKASAKATVKKHFGQLRYCYDRFLRTNASLEGRVEVGWSVFEGKVEGVYVVSNSTGSDELAECIVKSIERWEFDPSIQGDMSWPFVFRTQE